MSFVDEARIFVKAGDGGKGCESFFRDKHMRHPRPDGGDGGKGGDVIFQATRGSQTLLDYRFKQHYRASRGGHGSSKGKKGKEGQDCILKVPLGTLVKDAGTGLLMKDLVTDGQRVIAAHGGGGGRGNKNSRTPSSPGLGDEKTIHLELKLIADVGIIGFPNAGKSTLISNISKVKSRIGAYPFTTRQPILGVVECDDIRFTVADLPGLIEGAHAGKGLGDRFLKHAERTKVLVHLIDMAGTDGRDPLRDYDLINEELVKYSDRLSARPRLVVANKMDLPDAQNHIVRFRKAYREKILEISALTKNHLDILIQEMNRLVFSKETD